MALPTNDWNLLDMSESSSSEKLRQVSSNSQASSTTDLASLAPGSRLPSTWDLFEDLSPTDSQPASKALEALKSSSSLPTPESPVSDRQAAVVTKLLGSAKRLRGERDELRRAKEFAEAECRASREALAQAQEQIKSLSDPNYVSRVAELTESLASARATIVSLERQSPSQSLSSSLVSSQQPGTPGRSTIIPALRAQITELTSRVERRTEQIGVHQHEIKRLEAHLGMTQDTVQELQDELGQVEVQRQALVEDAELAREERDSARRSLTLQEGQLGDAEGAEEERVALVHTIFDVIGKARTNRRVADIYQTRFEAQLMQSRALRTQVEQRATEAELLMTQVDGVNARISALRQELQTQQLRVAEEKARADEAEQRAADAEYQAEAAKSSAAEDQTWAVEHKSKLDEAQAELARTKQQIIQLESKVADADSAKEELEACEVALEGLRDELEAERTSRTRSVDEIQATLDQYRAQASQKSSELDALKDEFIATAADLDSRNTQLATRTAELDSMQMDLETKTAELQFKDTQFGQLKGDHVALQGCLQALQSSFDAKQAEFETLSSNHHELQSELETVQAGYDAKQAEFRTLQSGFDALGTEIEQKNQEVLRLSAALDAGENGAQTELESLRAEVQVVRDAQAESKRTLDAVQAELAAATDRADVLGVEKSVLAGELRITKEHGAELRQRISELEGLAKGVDTVKVELEAVVKELESAKTERASMEQRYEEAQEQHVELQRQYNKTCQELITVQSRLSETQAQLEDVEMRAPAGEMDSLRAKVELMSSQVADMETLRAQVAEVEDLHVQVAELEDMRAQVVELERLVVEAQAAGAGGNAVALQARAQELERELQLRTQDFQQLEAHAKTLEEELRGFQGLREELKALRDSSIEQQNTIAALESRLTPGDTSEALDRLQEQYEMVLQDAKRMTAEVEGYDDRFIEVLKREKKLEIKVGNLTRKLRATQTKLDNAKAAQAGTSAPAIATTSTSAVVPETRPTMPQPASVPSISFAQPSRSPTRPLSNSVPPSRSPRRAPAASSKPAGTGTSSMFAPSTTSSAANSVFSASGSTGTGSLTFNAGSRFSATINGNKPPRSPARSPSRKTLPDFGSKLGSSSSTAPAPGRAALRPLPIFSASTQPQAPSHSQPISEPSKPSPESASRKRPIPDEFSDIPAGTHAEVALTTPRAPTRFKTLGGTGAGILRKGFTPARTSEKRSEGR